MKSIGFGSAYASVCRTGTLSPSPRQIADNSISEVHLRTYFSAFNFASDVFAVSANIPWDVKTSICTQMSQWQKIDAQQQKKADVEPCVVRKKTSSYVFWAVNRTQNLAMPSVTFTEWT